MKESTFYILNGILFLIFGIISTIALWKEYKKELKKEELKLIIYTLLLSTSISLACAGLDLIINN